MALQGFEPTRYPEICELLTRASAQRCDLIARGSNYIFLAKLALNGIGACYGIYKPRKGEAPLWDFPVGTLYRREYAAYVMSEALGWHFVPPTVIWDGPHGIGSLQLFIDFEPGVNYFDLRESNPWEVKRIAVFDRIVNNADRKGGHCIRDMNGRVWGIDHGLTFNAEYKLRTVIWDFGGQPIPREMLADVARERRRFHAPGRLAHMMKGVLGEEETQALVGRMQGLLDTPFFPEMRSRWDVPFPIV